jgi:hypothetical protein
MTAAVDHPAVTAAAIAAWEDPPRGARPDTAPVLSVDGFDGPLDWLLEMVRGQKIDLARLSIAALIEAFARAMTAALADHGWADPTTGLATMGLARPRRIPAGPAPRPPGSSTGRPGR